MHFDMSDARVNKKKKKSSLKYSCKCMFMYTNPKGSLKCLNGSK